MGSDKRIAQSQATPSVNENSVDEDNTNRTNEFQSPKI
jgi:hypothetical protein